MTTQNTQTSWKEKPLATRQAFGESLAELGAEFPNIVALDADLAKSTKSELFKKKFPERFFEMGISEMNMIGAAAGLSFTGKIPFACSFGCFLTGRYDTIRLSVAYSQANVRLVGTHSGVGIGDDGHSQMGLEDVGLMRSLPTMGVFQPMDAADTRRIMRYLVKEWRGPAYLRLTRQNMAPLSEEAERIGSKWSPLEPYLVKDDAKATVTFFVSGGPAEETWKASRELEAKGVHSRVVHIHCLKPLRWHSIAPYLKGVQKIVTVEDHSVIGGLGSAIGELLAENAGTAGVRADLVRIGVQDTFGESGEGYELYEKHGLDAVGIVKRVHG